MKENSIEEDIKILKELGQKYYKNGEIKIKALSGAKYIWALQNLLSDYKRVLKENEELKEYKKIAELTKISCCTAQNCEALNNAIKSELENQKLKEELNDINQSWIQKVKDKLEEYKNMLKTCNKAKDIDRIKAINERILELQELLEGGKEKTADELFDDLGLWLERETPFDFEVKNDDDKVIKFNKERREIACFNYYDGFEYLTLQELQAINKKCQELGWLKED